MQDPLKTNKAFQVAYSSHHAHKQFVTPQNIDQLIVTLNQIKVQKPDHRNNDNTMIIPPLPPQRDTMFVQSYIKTLPSIGGDRGDGEVVQRLCDGSDSINMKRYSRIAHLELMDSSQSVPLSRLGPRHMTSPPCIMKSPNKLRGYDISQHTGINHTYNEKPLGTTLGPSKPKVSSMQREYYQTHQKNTIPNIYSTHIKLRCVCNHNSLCMYMYICMFWYVPIN